MERTDEQRVFENVADMLLNGKAEIEVKWRGKMNRFHLVDFLKEELDKGVEIFPHVRELRQDLEDERKKRKE